jgi:hypothetical protein
MSEKKRIYCAVGAESINIVHSSILPTLNTNLHRHVALTRKTNRRNLRTSQKAMYSTFGNREALVISMLSLLS